MSRGAAEESFAAPRLMRFINQAHGLQPWLQSYAAPRLKPLSSIDVLNSYASVECKTYQHFRATERRLKAGDYMHKCDASSF